MVKDAVHPDGSPGYIWGIGEGPKGNQPVTYNKVPGSEDFGVKCFLFAGSGIYKLDLDMQLIDIPILNPVYLPQTGFEVSTYYVLLLSPL